MLVLTSPHKTRAHGLPAAVKLAALAGLTLWLFTLKGPLGPGLVLACLLVLAFLPGRDFGRAALAALRPLWPFVLIVGLYHLWLTEVAAGAAILLRMLAAVLAAVLVTMTTPLAEMLALFRRLLSPLRPLGLAPEVLAMALALMIRFIPVMLARAGQIADAHRARSPRRAPWRILTPLFLSALDDADHVSDALRARGGLE